MSEITLLIRADASAAIGTGHVMRCLALAQAWRDNGGRCAFVLAESTSSVEDRLAGEEIGIQHIAAPAGTEEDARLTAKAAQATNALWVVVDGYHFDGAYQRVIKEAGLQVLFLDDNVHAESYSADLILNQNLHAAESDYGKRASYTRLLLGPKYAMLRREFGGWSKWQRGIAERGRKILVTLGGSDPHNVSAKVIEAIRGLSIPDVEVVLLVGGSNPNLQRLEELGGKDPAVRLVTDATNVAEWMSWADAAVAGAGTTFWEMCFLGLPSILLVLAENQRRVAEDAERLGLAWSLGSAEGTRVSAIGDKLAELLSAKSARESQSSKGRGLVDGRGAERVVAALSDLVLRRSALSDCKCFWEWANDPEAREASFHNRQISWDEHKGWFENKMADRSAVLYTATNQCGEPLGQVRYQVNGSRAVLSINLSPRIRGCGWGRRILAAATKKFFRECEAAAIDAYVKPANVSSVKLFSKAGFARAGSDIIEGQEGVHFTLMRSDLG